MAKLREAVRSNGNAFLALRDVLDAYRKTFGRIEDPYFRDRMLDVEDVGRRIMVAWNASREAARAVNDALPLLKGAEEVKILALTAQGGIGAHGDLPGADIAGHLARHGVRADAEHGVVRDIEVGPALLSAAADFGADLLVMGSYGRARMRELILGGVSREILRTMTVPVLMSH